MISANDLLAKVSAPHLKKTNNVQTVPDKQQKRHGHSSQSMKALNWRDFELSDISLSDKSEENGVGGTTRHSNHHQLHVSKMKYQFLDSDDEAEIGGNKKVENRFLKSDKKSSTIVPSQARPSQQDLKPLMKTVPQMSKHRTSSSVALDKVKMLEQSIQSRGQKLSHQKVKKSSSDDRVSSSVSAVSLCLPATTTTSKQTVNDDLDVIPVRDVKDKQPQIGSDSEIHSEQDDVDAKSVTSQESSYKPVVMNLASVSVGVVSELSGPPSLSNDVTTNPLPTDSNTNTNPPQLALAQLGTSSKSFVNLAKVPSEVIGKAKSGDEVSESVGEVTESVGEVTESVGEVTESIDEVTESVDEVTESVDEVIATESRASASSDGSSSSSSGSGHSILLQSLSQLSGASGNGEGVSGNGEGVGGKEKGAGGEEEESMTHVTSEPSALMDTPPHRPDETDGLCTRCKKRDERRRGMVRECGVQTEVTPGPSHSPPPRHPPQPPVYLSDPPLLAPLLATDDQINAWATYNPTTLLATNLLRQQMSLVREFIYQGREAHRSVVDSLTRDYTYTTWKDTQNNIEKRRKPKLTFEEALKRVDEEMESDQRLLKYLRERRGEHSADDPTPVEPSWFPTDKDGVPDRNRIQRDSVTPGGDRVEGGTPQRRSESVNELFHEYLAWFRKSPFEPVTPPNDARNGCDQSDNG